MKPAKPRVFSDAAAAALACADHIAGLLVEAIGERGRATLAVSGGSTPRLLFDALVKRDVPWQAVQLFWADERAVPPDHPDSNFRLAKEHLIAPAAIPDGNVHRIFGELPPGEAAHRYAEEVIAAFRLARGELPRFDLVQLGMGPDGHTASLFPGDSRISDRTGIADAVTAPKPPPERVTVLPGVLLAASHLVFLVSGHDKKEAMRNVFHEPDRPERYPAQAIARNAREATWFVDTAAAALLD